MLVLGGGAISYERETPVDENAPSRGGQHIRPTHHPGDRGGIRISLPSKEKQCIRKQYKIFQRLLSQSQGQNFGLTVLCVSSSLEHGMKPTWYFTDLCSGSEAGSDFRLIDFVYHSNL